MKKETIKEYSILYQYLLLLKKPTYIYLVQIFQHLSPSLWWEKYIEPVLRYERKENFKYLDMSDMLNVFKMNWENIFRYLDEKYFKYKYDNEYKLVNKVHHIRTVVAHANDNDMSPFVLVDYLSCLLNYSRLINADDNIIQKLELDWMKYRRVLPENQEDTKINETLRFKILAAIEELLLKAINCETLPTDIKLSVDRTYLRFQSMRTVDEIVGFFNGAIYRSERGRIVQEALRNYGLLSFEDIKDEINEIFRKK